MRLIAIETNRVRVEVTLENRGLRTFDLPDSKTLGLQYYWSGDSTYNPGDQIIGGTYIKDFGDYANKLSPDGVYSLEITVPTTKKTRFSNYLVVIVDSFFNYDECNENNNVGSVSVIVD